MYKSQFVKFSQSCFAGAQILEGSRTSFYLLQEKPHNAPILVDMAEKARGQSRTLK